MPARLLAELAERGIALACGPQGRPRLVDPDHQLTHSALLRLLWDPWILQCALAGSRTGHYWHGCDACDQIQMLAKTKPGQTRPCVLTPGCEGAMVLIPFKVPELPKRVTVKLTSGAGPRRQGAVANNAQRPARPGDLLALVACPKHRSRRWVKRALLDEWRCAALVGVDGDGARECARPGDTIALGVIGAGGYPEITELPEGTDP